MKYTEYNVSRDRERAEEMVTLTGQMGIPVTVIDGEAVIGFDRARLQAILAGSGGRKPVHFGLKIADADRVAQKQGAIPVFGAVIGEVSPDSLGEKVGLRAGDIVAIMFLRGSENRKSEIVI